MKKKLAIFDFDSTIKQHGETFTLGGRAKLFPNQKIPEEFFDVYNEVHGTFYDLVNNAFNSLNYPKKDVIEALENDGTIVDGMDLVIKKLFTTHDIIIITGSDYETVKLFMAKHNLLTFVKKIYGRPARIYDNGKIILGDIPKEWAGPCKSCEEGHGEKRDYKVYCKTSILKEYIDNATTNKYENFIYFGDGHNDLCPALSFGANDIVCPRKGFKLDSMINEAEYSRNIEAKIIPWNSGFDILNNSLVNK